MVNKQFDRHLKYTTTISRGFANGLLLFGLSYLVFKPPIEYLIIPYFAIFAVWFLLFQLFGGKLIHLINKTNPENRKLLLFDIFTNIGDIFLNTAIYGSIMITLYCMYKGLPAITGIIGITSMLILSLIAYLLIEWITKKLVGNI
jgi:hypothetical protein